MNPLIRKLFTNTESDSFRALQKQVEISKSAQNSTDNANCDLTPDEYEQFLRLTMQGYKQSEQMPPIDFELSLRLAVQEHRQLEQLSPVTETENILPFAELINPEIMQDYQKLIEAFEARTKISKEHPEREFVDVEDGTFAQEIEHWTEKLIKELEAKKGSNLAQDDIHELEALTWFHFDSIATLLNAQSISLDIDAFYKSPHTNDKPKTKDDLLNRLAKKYPLKKDELEILIDLMTSEKDSKSLYKTMVRVWKQYELGKRKGDIVKIVSSYSVACMIRNTIPFFFKDGVVYGTAAIPVGHGIAASIDCKTTIKMAKFLKDIRTKINKRITDSLFFRRFEFTQTQPLGEIFKTLESGKESTVKLISGSMSQLVPSTVGVLTAFTSMTLIHPLLTVINLLGIPGRYFVGRFYNSKIAPIHEAKLKKEEQVATELSAVKEGLQQILTSPNIPEIAESVKTTMDDGDELSLATSINQTKMRFASFVSFNSAVLASTIAGIGLRTIGEISEGAVYSNFAYAASVNAPFESLVDLYFNEFARCIQSIERMEEVLGEVDKLDLPDGEKESRRIPVSALANHDIFVKDLWFKDILKDIDLDIHEGEFVTIEGSSGVGKSTLLKNIVGLYQPDSGSVQIGGVDIDDIKKYTDESIYSIMSYCNQEPPVFKEMTLRQNLMLWSSKPVDDLRLKEVLESLNLHKFTEKLDEKFEHFSGGEKVRLGLARILIKNPKIMLLDEPTSSLDSESALEVRNILRKLHQQYPETTIVCVTHDKELVKENLQSGGRSINLGNNSN